MSDTHIDTERCSYPASPHLTRAHTQRYFYPASDAAAEGEPLSRACGGSPSGSELALAALADAGSPESSQSGALGKAAPGAPSPQVVVLLSCFPLVFPLFSLFISPVISFCTVPLFRRCPLSSVAWLLLSVPISSPRHQTTTALLPVTTTIDSCAHRRWAPASRRCPK